MYSNTDGQPASSNTGRNKKCIYSVGQKKTAPLHLSQLRLLRLICRRRHFLHCWHLTLILSSCCYTCTVWTIVYGALASVAVLWRPRSHRYIIIIIIKQWWAYDVCLTHTSGLSREQRDHRKTKIDTEVAHVTSPGQNAQDKMPRDKMPLDKMPPDKMPPTVEFVFIFFECCFHLLPYRLTCRNRL